MDLFRKCTYRGYVTAEGQFVTCDNVRLEDVWDYMDNEDWCPAFVWGKLDYGTLHLAWNILFDVLKSRPLADQYAFALAGEMFQPLPAESEWTLEAVAIRDWLSDKIENPSHQMVDKMPEKSSRDSWDKPRKKGGKK
jgi:hypothetical protein